MEIEIDGLAKRYIHRWVFRNLTLHIPAFSHLAVTGPNGSGKSTFVKIVSTALSPSEGTLTYRLDGMHITPESIFRYVSFAAPYAEMIEEMTLPEAVRFHQRFKPFYSEVGSYGLFTRELNYEFPSDQQIQHMSSGMKQRIRLAFALCTRTPLLVLDEPTSNLDEPGIRWYHAMLDRFGHDRTVIIASNVEADLLSCRQRLSLESRVTTS